MLMRSTSDTLGVRRYNIILHSVGQFGRVHRKHVIAGTS